MESRSSSRTQNVHVRAVESLVSPREIIEELPLSEAARRTVVEGRAAVEAILRGEDDRLIVVVGPCSIHDEKAALEYANRLQSLAAEVSDRLLVIMRVYFEKPRTTVGWKGLLNDPDLNDSFNIAKGLRLARQLMLSINELGLPLGTEMLDPITPQYIADAVAWSAIGARTTESQTHRQMASGLSMPVGLKNGTDGDLDTAINALISSAASHSFLGIDEEGRTAVIHTTGNTYGHMILRGGRGGPNYDGTCVADAVERLTQNALPANIMIDCSHANSNKDHRRQAGVFQSILQQRLHAPHGHHLIGAMIESNLQPGAQKLADPAQLQYGVSITDACIGWDETASLLRDAHQQLAG